MSDLFTCIVNGMNEGEITPEQGARAQASYRTFFDALEGVIPPEQQARVAARQTFDELELDAIERRRRFRLSEAKARRIELEISQHPLNADGANSHAAMLAYFYDDGFAKYPNIADRQSAILGMAHAEMGEMVLDFMRGIFGGQRNKKLLDDTVDELFGSATGNGKASDYAGRFYRAAEMLRTLFNAEGGTIGKADNWGLPTRHDAALFRRSTFDQWREFVLPKLNRAKMIDRVTGEPFSDARLELALFDMFEAVSTRNWSREAPKRQGGGMSMANRRSEERFLIFKDGQSWREYQEAFGSGNPYHVMLDHLDDMSRDIAAMQMFGPNPPATLEWLGQTVDQRVTLATRGLDPDAAEKAVDKARTAVERTRMMWRAYTGEVNNPANIKIANAGQTTRNYLTGTLLGGTPLVAAPTDIMSQIKARRFAGLRTTRTVTDVLKHLNPASRKHRIQAIRSGIINQHAAQVGLAAARYTGERGGKGMSGTYADAALRLNGLSQVTQAGRHAMGMEYLGVLGDNIELPFDQLNDGLKRVLRRGGLEADWETLRRAPIDPNLPFLNVDAIGRIEGLSDARRTELAIRLLSSVQQQQEFSVPSGSLRSRTFLQGNSQPGTLGGELVKSMTMFKSFPVTIVYMHMARTLAIRAEKGGIHGAGYPLAIFGMMTVGGAFALQSQQIANGRDPLDMTTASFWAAASLKGGGLGIWGDVLAQTDSPYGGMEASAAGPVAATIQDVGELTVGNVLEAAKGDDMRLGRDVTRFTRNYMPFGRTWYLRMAKDRILMDELQKMIDPDAEAQFRRKVREAKRENNQEYFWKPGQSLPDRAPDLAAVVDE
jgi:hypothetical protein